EGGAGRPICAHSRNTQESESRFFFVKHWNSLADDHARRLRSDTLGTDCRQILRRRLKLPELPARWIIGQFGINRGPDCMIIRIVKAEFVERQGQTHATRLDIGFLESPVLEEPVLPLMRWREHKGCNFLRSEIAAGNIHWRFTRADVLDIHSQSS